MGKSDEQTNPTPDARGPALLPPPPRPSRTVLRSIAALEEIEANGANKEGRAQSAAHETGEPPIIEATAADRKFESRSRGDAPSTAKQDELQPLRAKAFRANAPERQAKADRRPGWLGRVAAACVLLGAGWLGGAQISSSASSIWSPAASGGAQASPLDQLRQELRIVSSELEGVRAQIVRLDAPEQRARNANAFEALTKSLGDISRRIEQVRSAQTAAIVEIGARLERARSDEARQREELSERIARIERQLSDGQPTGTHAAVRPPNSTIIPRVAVAPAPSGADPLASRRPAAGLGYVVREVYNGVALIEGRNGYLEVYPGAMVPGAGRVQQITRRSGQWVVVTTGGVIGAQVQ